VSTLGPSGPVARMATTAALDQITTMLYRLNVDGYMNLVLDAPDHNSVYRHLREAGEALCRQLGWPVDETMDQLVTTTYTTSDIAKERGEFK